MDARRRGGILLLIFFSLLMIIVARLAFLQLIKHQFFLRRSVDQRTRIINLSSGRGAIFDRNGSVLAVSIDTYSVFSQKGGFKWVARKLPQAAAAKLKAGKPADLFILKEKKRIYPKRQAAAQVIGFIGTDDQGLSGVELACDKYLKGKVGKIVTEGDPEGRELPGALREIEPGEDGMNVTLTIDENIQYIAEREIEDQIRKSHATAGLLLVMDAKTGELLAMASKPDFDPNEFGKADRRRWHPRFLDPYEPGSTFKIFTAAAGLEERVIDLETRLKELDKIEIGGKVVENSHKIKWTGRGLTISRMLEDSINTGTVQVGVKLGPEKFYNNIRNFGFGTATDFGLDGESRGIVRHWRSWYKPDVGMITFGQGIAVTPLQLLSAASAFANHGRIVKPALIKKIESNDGRFVKTFSGNFRGRAVSERVVADMKKLLRNIVLNGSGKRAKMAAFTVGGKTGTAQKALPGGRGYMKGRFIASFIGLAPLSDPQVIALVIIDDPQGSIWGESVCGPVFKTVVEYSLRYLNAKPDML